MSEKRVNFEGIITVGKAQSHTGDRLAVVKGGRIIAHATSVLQNLAWDGEVCGGVFGVGVRCFLAERMGWW